MIRGMTSITVNRTDSAEITGSTAQRVTAGSILRIPPSLPAPGIFITLALKWGWPIRFSTLSCILSKP